MPLLNAGVFFMAFKPEHRTDSKHSSIPGLRSLFEQIGVSPIAIWIFYPAIFIYTWGAQDAEVLNSLFESAGNFQDIKIERDLEDERIFCLSADFKEDNNAKCK